MVGLFNTKLPQSIIVGPHKYVVITDVTEVLRKNKELNCTLMGHVDIGRCEIFIDQEFAATTQRDTLLHEVLHCIADSTNLAGDWGTEREEEVIRRLTPILLDTLRRNPDLVKCLLAESQE